MHEYKKLKSGNFYVVVIARSFFTSFAVFDCEHTHIHASTIAVEGQNVN